MEPQIMSNTLVSNESTSNTSWSFISSDNQILEPLTRLNIEDEFSLLEPIVTINHDSHTYTDLDSFPQTKCNATAMEMPRAIDFNFFNWSTNGAENIAFGGLNSEFQQFYPGYDLNIGYQNCDENKSPNVVYKDYTHNSNYKISNKLKTKTQKQKYTPYLTFVCEICGFDGVHNVTLQIHKLTHAKEQSS